MGFPDGIAQQVKKSPASRRHRRHGVRSLGCEDALEKEMVTHSNILAWKIPGTEEPGGLESMGLQRAKCSWETEQNTKAS